MFQQEHAKKGAKGVGVKVVQHDAFRALPADGLLRYGCPVLTCIVVIFASATGMSLLLSLSFELSPSLSLSPPPDEHLRPRSDGNKAVVLLWLLSWRVSSFVVFPLKPNRCRFRHRVLCRDRFGHRYRYRYCCCHRYRHRYRRAVAMMLLVSLSLCRCPPIVVVIAVVIDIP